MHIVVLKGGLSAEREVSLSSAQAVCKNLRELAHDVTEIDVTHDIAEKLACIRPDIVFNALHGTYGEDGCIQGLLEIMQIPYTHSGVMASAVAMHKPTAKKLFESVGIKCAKGIVSLGKEIADSNIIAHPYIIKPVDEGSSVGIYIVTKKSYFDFSKLPANKEFLIEEFIAGRELTIGIIGGQATQVCEISPKDGFYDYENKYVAGKTDYIMPANLPDNITAQAQESALKAHQILGCRGVSRADFRYGDDGQLYMLEVNTHPGMTQTSLIPKLANNMGMSFTQLVAFLIDNARLDNG